MVMVVGTIQIGNPVGQPQIIPVSGDLQQNETKMVLQEVESPDISAMLGAVSAVQQVWYDFKDVSSWCLKKGPP